MLVSTLSNDIAISLGIAFLASMLWLLFFSKAPAEGPSARDELPDEPRDEPPSAGS